MARKFGFVILNYITPDETRDCVASIDAHVREEHEIVIVDNASLDDSGRELMLEYEGRADVSVILSKKNLGFAAGNNVGIKKARQDGCDYIVVMNSDTKLIQDDFAQIIDRNYIKYGYAVIGPSIYKNGIKSSDNPGRCKMMSSFRIHVFILMNYLFLAMSYIGADGILNELFIRYANSKKKEMVVKDSNVAGVALHGCCLVFTPTYFEKFDGFDDRTYMYMEEEVLFHHLIKEGLVSAYVPELCIEHIQEAATNKLYQGVKRRRFKYRNYIHSSKVLLSINRMLK